MSATAVHEMLLRWEDDELPAPEVEALADLLAADPAARREWVRQCMISSELARRFRERTAFPADGAGRGLPARLPRGVARAATFAAAAALLAAAVGVALWASRGGRPAPFEVAELVGEARLSRADGAVETLRAAGASLRPGEALETGAGARAVLRARDGSRVLTNESTSVSLRDPAGPARLTLDSGEIYVEAVPRPGTAPWVLNPGRDDETAVAGTAFELARNGGLGRVRVEKGAVRFGLGESAVLVIAGQESRSGPGLAPSPPAPVSTERIALWRRGRTLYAEWLADGAEPLPGNLEGRAGSAIGYQTGTSSAPEGTPGTVIWVAGSPGGKPAVSGSFRARLLKPGIGSVGCSGSGPYAEDRLAAEAEQWALDLLAGYDVKLRKIR